MTLQNLGYDPTLENYRKENNLDSFAVGRVVLEHKERYVVKTTDAEYEAEIIGNLRFAAQSRADFPAVGDWVAFSEYDENKVLIHAVLPRKTIIERQSVGKFGEKQIIATNIDYAFVVQAVDRDFNLNRIERYLTLCYNSKVEPVIVLSKTDLIEAEELNELTEKVENRIKNVQLITISNQNLDGYEKLKSIIEPGKTYCLLGSSGVGKSTLTNNLSGGELMKTGSVSLSTAKGKHVTSHRELVVLESGGILIDNPGMREVGMTESAEGLAQTFDLILELASECKFADCKHINEKGCAVLKAVEEEVVNKETYENYQKMEREKIHFESTIAEKRKKDKQFGKMVKEVMKNKKMRK
jgi:ribosome biogenesis GTPase / thiamine phosphate phosphatase